jgi:ribosomal protein S18 acetylase RimI-like enzyme
MSARPEPTRMARPDDYDAIAAVVNDWWGRPVLPALPRLFLDHFYRTSLVVDDPGGPNRPDGPGGPQELRAFLIGILSPSEPDHAYIHFVGVSPAARQRGLARQLYAEFFALARGDGRQFVSAVTAPVNGDSIAFHRSLGFAVTGPVADYDGPGRDYIVFERRL